MRFAPSRSKQLDKSAFEEEKAQYMSVTGVLMWIARICHPGISCGVRTLQSSSRSSAVSDILLCNSMMKHSQADPTVALTFKSVLAWSSQAGAPLQMCVAAVSETSHGNASAHPDRLDVRGAFWSLGGKVVFLAAEDLCEKQEGHMHIITYGSVVHKRVDKNTNKADTYQLFDVVDPTVVCYERASQMLMDTQYGRVLPSFKRACGSPSAAPDATR